MTQCWPVPKCSFSFKQRGCLSLCMATCIQHTINTLQTLIGGQGESVQSVKLMPLTPSLLECQHCQAFLPLSHFKFEHKKGPPPLVVGILLVVGCIITLVMHSNLKLPSTPRKKERKKRREKSLGFGVHQQLFILSL